MSKPKDQYRKPVDFMMKGDAMSQWMGIEVMDVDQGAAVLEMSVRKEMLNGFHIVHGGILFALADSAMAFAANTYGQLALVTDAHIQFPASATEGDLLVATASEIARARRKGFYEVEIRIKSSGSLIAKYSGSVYITQKPNPPN